MISITTLLTSGLNGNGNHGEEHSKMHLDDVFHLLSNSRRRNVIKILKQNGPMDKTELAEQIAAEENDCDVSALGCQERKRAVVSLHQCHLPKLEDHNVIEKDHNVIRLGGNADQLLEFID